MKRLRQVERALAFAWALRKKSLVGIPVGVLAVAVPVVAVAAPACGCISRDDELCGYSGCF